MKRLFCCLLICAFLFSCAPQQQSTPSTVLSESFESLTSNLPESTAEPSIEPPAESSSETSGYDKSMTELANRLGITAENYPRMDGSTSTLQIVQEIWYAMIDGSQHPQLSFPETASKTVPSYHKLINGEVDLIFVPYASTDVLREAEEAGVELQFHKIAAEALVFITPKENTAENITRDQVRSIYLDYGITNWRDLGGSDHELIPICRNADSGSQSQMDNLVLENEPMHPDIQNNYVELTMEGMLELVAFYHYGGIGGEPTNSYALGYTLFSYLNNMYALVEAPSRLKLLSFDGVMPTTDSIADGSYSLADGYYAVTRGDLPEDHSAYTIISWLQSSEGTKLTEDIGLIPLEAE